MEMSTLRRRKTSTLQRSSTEMEVKVGTLACANNTVEKSKAVRLRVRESCVSDLGAQVRWYISLSK